MSTIDILIVEDSDIVAREIKISLLEKGYNVIKTVDNGKDALVQLEELSPDLVIMDIGIKGEMDGIATASKMRELNPTPIIYLTGHSDKLTYNRAKKTYPEAFLSKPFNDQDLSYAIDLALQNFTLKKKAGDEVGERQGHYVNDNTVFIRNENRFEKVNIDEILYVTAEGSYSTIKTTKREFILSLNLSVFGQKLRHPKLQRVHRSYIVNIDQIHSFKLDRIYVGDCDIPISKRYRNDFLDRMNHI